MIKFESPDLGVGVIAFAKPAPGKLNRHLIMLLEYLNVPLPVFEKKLKEGYNIANLNAFFSE